MASIERTAYRRFKRFMSVRELHVFYTPQPDEIVWAGEAAGSDEHLLALVTLAADDDGVYIGILRAPGPRVGSGPGGGPGILFS
jgi:hypothetical protein